VAAPGLAPLLAAEIAALGVAVGAVAPAGVAFVATADDLLRVNLWSRLATRVLVRLAAFAARDFAALERQAARVPWTRVLDASIPVRLRVTCRKSRLYHSDAVAERVARGIAGAIPGVSVAGGAPADDAEVVGPGGDADGHRGDSLVVVRLDRDQCTISVDSSGDLLHRRGWRLATAKAPLRETLAAALLAVTGWAGDVPLVDPLGGSGTIGIEAALLARGMAPGLGRRFACERWPGMDAGRIATLRDDAARLARPAASVPIVVADRDPGACEAVRANAARAGVGADVTVVQRALSETDLAAMGPRGWVVTNPPYGVRVSGGRDLRGLYARLGDIVRAAHGWRLALVVADERLAGQLRLPLETALRTVNGGLPIRFAVTPGG
jgi:putative N6-adenine-specific DNA methylase